MTGDPDMKHFLTYNKQGQEAFLCKTSITDKNKMTDKFSEITCKNCRTILRVLLK